MQKVREVLQTEYIGAILVGLLFANAFGALFGWATSSLWYQVFFARTVSAEHMDHAFVTYDALAVLVRIVLYLAAGYLLARWLYGKSSGSQPNGRKAEKA